jgi:hypothetical protein
MPKEMRQILFSAGEVVSAVTDYHRRRNLPLPLGTVLRCVILDDPEVRGVLVIQSDDRQLIDLAITAEMLAASLILYCINRKIPLPAEAEKKLQKVGENGVALFVITRPKNP